MSLRYPNSMKMKQKEIDRNLISKSTTYCSTIWRIILEKQNQKMLKGKKDMWVQALIFEFGLESCEKADKTLKRGNYVSCWRQWHWEGPGNHLGKGDDKSTGDEGWPRACEAPVHTVKQPPVQAVRWPTWGGPHQPPGPNCFFSELAMCSESP